MSHECPCAPTPYNQHHTELVDIKQGAKEAIGEHGLVERIDSARSRCKICEAESLHCEGSVLVKLPAKLKNCFDVDPEYATGDLYLTKYVSRSINNQVRNNIVTTILFSLLFVSESRLPHSKTRVTI